MIVVTAFGDVEQFRGPGFPADAVAWDGGGRRVVVHDRLQHAAEAQCVGRVDDLSAPLGLGYQAGSFSRNALSHHEGPHQNAVVGNGVDGRDHLQGCCVDAVPVAVGCEEAVIPAGFAGMVQHARQLSSQVHPGGLAEAEVVKLRVEGALAGLQGHPHRPYVEAVLQHLGDRGPTVGEKVPVPDAHAGELHDTVVLVVAVSGDGAGFQARGHGHDLHHRARFVMIGAGRIGQQLRPQVGAAVGVEGRSADRSQDRTGAGLHHQNRAADGVLTRERLLERCGGGLLQLAIQGEPQVHSRSSRAKAAGHAG